MKLNVAIHYWPSTPDLKEIKIKDGSDTLISSFMNLDQIEDLELQLTNIVSQLQQYRIKQQHD